MTELKSEICGKTFTKKKHGSKVCCSEECRIKRDKERNRKNKKSKSAFPPGFKLPTPPKTYKEIQAENRHRCIASGWRGQRCMGGYAA